jgi:hypothetical protein
MPKLSRVINGCGYDPVNHAIGFRVDDYAVVIDGRQMLIIGTQNQAEVWMVLDWLAEKIIGDENNVKKQGNHIHKELGRAA